MKKLVIFAFTLFSADSCNAQILLNGDFSLGTLFWGCSIETDIETTYGGLSGSNTVAEIDALANMCQTVSGLTIGNVYALSCSATRRTGGCPGPPVTNVNITMSGGVLSTVLTRTNTTFGFTTTGFLFTATSTSHLITFMGGSGFAGSSCGMIIDNVAVTRSGLPIELLGFDATANSNLINFAWSTATEKNNDHFEIENSSNGVDFATVITMPTDALSGNSSKKLDYKASDLSPKYNMNYYRLKQVDKDQNYSYSKIVAVAFDQMNTPSISMCPNPTNGEFTIHFLNPAKVGQAKVMLIGTLGKELFSQTFTVDDTANSIHIDAKDKVTEGRYYCTVSTDTGIKHFPLIVE